MTYFACKYEVRLRDYAWLWRTIWQICFFWQVWHCCDCVCLTSWEVALLCNRAGSRHNLLRSGVLTTLWFYRRPSETSFRCSLSYFKSSTVVWRLMVLGCLVTRKICYVAAKRHRAPLIHTLLIFLPGLYSVMDCDNQASRVSQNVLVVAFFIQVGGFILRAQIGRKVGINIRMYGLLILKIIFIGIRLHVIKNLHYRNFRFEVTFVNWRPGNCGIENDFLWIWEQSWQRSRLEADWAVCATIHLCHKFNFFSYKKMVNVKCELGFSKFSVLKSDGYHRQGRRWPKKWGNMSIVEMLYI